MSKDKPIKLADNQANMQNPNKKGSNFSICSNKFRDYLLNYY